jgi:alanine-synthesizing transaminase
MFVWAPIPEPYHEMGSVEFAKFLVTDADLSSRASATCGGP